MSEQDKTTVRISKLVGCARCDGTHEDLVFTRFARPAKAFGEVLFSHWATCPETGDPILMIPLITAEEAEAAKVKLIP